jgi:hypothetical protein
MLSQGGRPATPSPVGGGGVFDPTTLAVAAVLGWLVVSMAVVFDAGERDVPESLWGLVTFVGGPFGLLLYLAIVVYG